MSLNIFHRLFQSIKGKNFTKQKFSQICLIYRQKQNCMAVPAGNQVDKKRKNNEREKKMFFRDKSSFKKYVGSSYFSTIFLLSRQISLVASGHRISTGEPFSFFFLFPFFSFFLFFSASLFYQFLVFYILFWTWTDLDGRIQPRLTRTDPCGLRRTRTDSN